MNNNDIIASQIRNIQILGSIAVIASPVSLVFGGVLLSTIALICAVVALSKIKALESQADVSADIVAALRRQARVGLAVSIGALVINCVFLIMRLSVVIPLLESGNYEELSQMFGLVPPEGNVTSSGNVEVPDVSIWDR